MRRVFKKSGQLGKTNWDAVIRVYDEAGNVIETHEQAKEDVERSRLREAQPPLVATEDSAHRKRRAEADDGPKPGTLGAFVGEGNERVGKHGKNATGGECSHPRFVHFRHNAGGAVTDDRRYAACEHNPGP